MSSSSSSLSSGKRVDVFLSSSDDRDSVFQDYLFDEYSITTFRSYKFLETSIIPIDQQTHLALEEAKVAVVMMSETNPYTVGFLEELTVILEFQKKGSLKVIPIFLTPYLSYDLEEDLWKQFPKYAESWKTAVAEVHNIAVEYNVSLNVTSMDQSYRLKKIADDIYLLLLDLTSKNSNFLVAMDRHKKMVYDLLALEVNEEVRTIGICGSAGVGKTTLARYIYGLMSIRLQTCVFLENVENMKDKILEFEGEEDPLVIRYLDRDVHKIIEARRKHSKVLLIADDMTNSEQGKWIIEYANWFAPGSRVILISQNENLLVDAGVKHVYQFRSLRYDEALQLFSHFAFGQPYPPSNFQQLAVRAVQLSGFLPLSLRLLGSFLNGRGREEWLAALLKLKAKKGGSIMEVWKLMEPSGDEKIMEGKESATQDKPPLED